MREISSKEYAEMVEDTIFGSLEDALRDAFDFIMKTYGMEYAERQVKAENMVTAFYWGFGDTWRDQAIELFEMYGMDVKPDGRDF